MKYIVTCNCCQGTNLKNIGSFNYDDKQFKCLDCDEYMSLKEIEFTQIKGTKKERCSACNGSGWYDACDKNGNPIPCGACDGTGFETD